ncbi:MAG: gliding motility-associated C-terminal domain-containing protein [Bacteroidota bacterium]
MGISTNLHRLFQNRLAKVAFVFCFGLLTFQNIHAQLSAALVGANAEYGNGEDFCVDFIVDDFTDFYLVNFSITWNEEVIQFTGVEIVDNDNALNIQEADLITSRTDEGIFTFNWEDESGDGVTVRTRDFRDLENGVGENYSLFRLCFRTSDRCGGTTTLNINEASETIFRAGADDRNIGFADGSEKPIDDVFDADISVAGTPVTISASQHVVDPEEIVCVTILAEEFAEVEGVQYSLRWDTDVLEFQNIEALNPDFPFLSTTAIATGAALSDGVIRFSWLNSSGGGTTVPGDTPMFDVCFRVVGEGGSRSDIAFTSDPLAVEIATINEGGDACKLLSDGEVLVREQKGEVTVKAGSGAVKPGESICVDVTADDFFAVNEVTFSVNWNPTVFRFDSISNMQLQGISDSDFFLTNANTGFFTFTWDDPNGVLLQDGSTLFSICFTAIGSEGSSTPISFTGEPQRIFVSTTSNNDAGLNTRNGNLTILPPESLNLNVSNATVSPNEAFCVDITAQNFEEMVALNASMGWEINQIEFDRVDNFGIAGLDEGDFDLSQTASGFLSIDWASPNAAGETLADDAVLFSICFRSKASAQLGLCDAIFFSDIPAPIRAVTANSGGNSVEVTDLGNDICIFDPSGLTVNVTNNLQVNVGEEICVPITVRNFNNLSAVQFSVNWNPSLFEFSSISNLASLAGRDANTVGTDQANLGIVTFDWDNEAGANLNNGEALFEICLTAVGSRLMCGPMEITNAPTAFEVISPIVEDQNLSLNPINAEICIADGLELELLSTTNPSCEDSDNGEATIVLNGGTASTYEYFWQDAEGQVVSVSASASNLVAGTYIVNVTDGSGLMLSDTFTLTAQNPTPIANAGNDQTLVCGTGSAVLNGIGSTVGENINFDWNVIEGGGFQSGQNFFVQSAGTYELIVTNDSTMCSSRDTVAIAISEDLNADAGANQLLTCDTDGVTLDGSNSDQADDLTYRWLARDGGEVGADSTNLSIDVNVAGTYILIVSQGDGCIARDTVEVTDTRINIVADAGVDKTLDCSGEGVIIGGPTTTQGETILAQWTGDNIEDGLGDSIVVNLPGTYILTVTDQVSGCTAQDTVEITANEELPNITEGFIDNLSCSVNEVRLNVQVTNVSGTLSFQWSKEGVPLSDTLATARSPLVSEEGVYEVLVTDGATGCTGSLGNIVVERVITEPTADIGGESVLGCQSTSSIFLTAGNSSSGDNFVYTWGTADTSLAIRSIVDSAEVFAAGIYYLTVTDATSGCTAIDSVVVTATDERPTVSIADAAPIPCNDGTTTLDGSASSAGTYDWIVLEGDGVISDATTAIATVDAPGLYRLRVTDELGCTAIDSIRVTQSDTSSIQFEVNYSAQDLTCLVNSSEISISVLSEGDYTFEWRAQDGQTIPDATAASNILTEPGLILVDVTETNLNCTKTAIVTLNLDAEISELFLETDSASLTLDCGGGGVTLDASATTLSGFETINWRGPDGTILAALEGNTTPQVTQAGTYTAILSNSESGCSDSLSVEVTTASDLEAIIETPDLLTCENETVLLRAFNSSSGQTIEYEWSSADGNDIRPIDTGNGAIVDQPGIYSLTVRDTETECETTVSVTVEANRDTPTADAGMDDDLGCGNTLQIGGTGTSTGADLTYAWTRDGQPLSETNPRIDIDAPGTYELVVTNATNGCTATDQVTITQNFQLELADAGSDEVTCDTDSLFLFGNLPPDTRGIWRTNSGATIADPNDSETMISGLTRGDNFFLWTLSTAQCPDYSSDTLVISVELAPMANNDRATLDLNDADSVGIKVIANDDLFNIADWTITIDKAPNLGTAISNEAGTISYSAFSVQATTDEFTYTICSATCPDLCSTATVSVDIQVPEGTSLLDNQPNVITPNGDGFNDQLIFDLVENGTYPDNDIIIFNRWGDVVYRAMPYMNDWGGNGENGKKLPHGTYFYILRLDIAEGLILRGDVTIME